MADDRFICFPSCPKPQAADYIDRIMLATARHEIEEEDDSEVLDAAQLGLRAEPAVPARIVVPADNEGERLDKVLARLLPDLSRSRIKQWIEQGAIRLNDRLPAVRAEVLAGDVIELAPPPSPQASAFQAEPIPLEVIHADESILVINKPPGLVVHPGAGNWSGTLLNGLLAYDSQQASLPRAGIVHRLDADTSGLMVIARTTAAQLDLVRQLQTRTVEREYWAIVHGTAPPQGSVDGAIARDPRQPLRFKVSAGVKAKPAHTRYRRVDTAEMEGGAFSWLECRLDTGRTHQIRVHLESIGLPLVGDPVYRRGRPASASTAAISPARFGRQALHACRLGLVHPRSGAPLHWFRHPPMDMQGLMVALGFDPRRGAGVRK
jgi:23S rRNA pseudouridine1911/1915/1917 synthase